MVGVLHVSSPYVSCASEERDHVNEVHATEEDCTSKGEVGLRSPLLWRSVHSPIQLGVLGKSVRRLAACRTHADVEVR